MNDIDYFELLGLPRQFDLNLQDVEANYLRRSRDNHPDYHQNSSSLDQQTSLQIASRLNEAYRILKEPFSRAEYLLTRLGGPPVSEVKEMPQEFLSETLELRMQLEELKDLKDQAGLDQLENDLLQRKKKMLQEVGKLFGESSVGDHLRTIRQKLNALKYVQGLIRDLRDI